MLFAYPTGVQGNVVSQGVNELVIPNYKQTWGNIRKIADAPEGVKHSPSSRRSTRSDQFGQKLTAPRIHVRGVFLCPAKSSGLETPC